MPRPNLVLIVIDCLRIDRMGCYGAADSQTPAVDALATEGTVFEQAVAMGFHTPTTMTAVISGCYPSTYGGFSYLSPQRPQVPVALQEAGYRTAAFVPNPYLYPERGFDRGFDRFEECWPPISRRGRNLPSLSVRALNRLGRPLGIHVECPPYLDASALTDQALQWLSAVEGPFFLWLHYMDAHTPYALDGCSLLMPNGRGQKPYDAGFWKRLRHEPENVTEADVALAKELYDAGIRSIDAQIARLKQFLVEQESPRETFLVIMADHGEMFYEHGQFGHANGLYEPMIHVPLIVTPSLDGVRRRIPSQVRQFDLAPTLVEVAGGMPRADMQAKSLSPALHGATLVSRPAISQTIPRPGWQLSLREPPWKLIWQVDPESLEGVSEELYALDQDPDERENLAPVFPERVEKMKRVLRNHAGNLDLRDLKGPEPVVDPAIGARLRALGYTDAE